jgi:chaperone required for assembly of F1-ATPase
MREEPPIDPIKAAQRDMRPILPRRFYAKAGYEPRESGFALTLDGRAARTPGKSRLVLPTEPIAVRVAEEWEAQRETINAAHMPLTRLANSAIDGVSHHMAETRATIAEYAGSDLVCYRAAMPEALVEAQARAYDPVLEWARDAHGARFILGEGVMHVRQPGPSITAIVAALERVGDPFPLAALHVATTLTGSALLALAVRAGRLDAAEAWRAANVDEDYQISKWGEDREAAVNRAARWREMEAAALVLRSS